MARYSPFLCCVLAAFLLAGCRSAPSPVDHCTPLFDGAGFSGWTPIGHADFAVETDEDGTPVIAGRAVYGIPNSFLRTNATYDDFDLSLSFRVDSGFNSGIQFRSAVAEDTVRFDRHQEGRGAVRPQTTLPGTVFGYQADIDPTPRGWTGHIYEESARGWLQTFSTVIKPRDIIPDTWHDLRIRAVGDSIRTWLDGTPAAELVDNRAPGGFIALQVHAVYDSTHTGRTVRFKNLTLCTP